jgi:hypothetical protein
MKVAAEIVTDVEQRPLAPVDADARTRPDARGGQLIEGAPGEDVYVRPVQRLVALVGLGLPDPLAFLGGVLRTQRQHADQHLLITEYGHRAEAEVRRIHRAQRRQVQGCILLDALHDHRQLVHMRHHPRRPRAFVSGAAPDQADQICGLVDPELVDRRLELAATDVANGVLLAARPVCPQQLLK